MRVSHLFGQTLRESPSDAEMPSHQLALRAGLIRQVAQGIYSFMPVGWRVMRRIEAIVREEMDAIGGQELSMPVVQPAELWQTTGRYQAASPGSALVRFEDRNGHPLVLGMTHEEVVTALAAREIRSYRQLPSLVYQIQVKFRDEPRSRGGLMRVREFIMKDGYSFDADAAGMARAYERVFGAYRRIFARCGLDAVPVEAGSGMMGGSHSHEFMVLNENGEDTLMRCPGCGLTANVETARVGLGELSGGDPQPLAQVATPGRKTIRAVADYVGVETTQTLKVVLYVREDTNAVVMAVIRGDLDVNEQKLSAVLGGVSLMPADEALLLAAGLVPGYASPVGISGIMVVADQSVRTGTNFVAGANEVDHHLVNVNTPRDFCPDMWADIALAREGDACPDCGTGMEAVRAIEVGHVFQLGKKYSRAFGASYIDSTGESKPLEMGCYGIGLGRVMACVIERHHDDFGIVWPVALRPFDVHLVSLGGQGSEVAAAADALYDALGARGLSVLYDDRDERPGVKFNDADLIGTPVRLTMSRRTLAQGAVELKLRWGEQAERVSAEDLDALAARIRTTCAEERPNSALV